MNQEDALDFDVFSQACLREPVGAQQLDCAAMADLICFGDLREDDLDFDVLGQADFQEPTLDLGSVCAADRIWTQGLRNCGRATPFYRVRACSGRGPAKRQARVAAIARRTHEYWRQRLAGAQDPPS